jgi:TM2 domain-containing membrane protein YozV
MSQSGPFAPPPPAAPENGVYPATTSPAPPQGSTFAPQKSFLTTWLLSLLVGGLGADRFYLGKIWTGILKLITLGGVGVWSLVDLIIILLGKQTDKNRQPLEGYDRHRVLALIVSGALVIGGMIVGGVIGVATTIALQNAASQPLKSPTPVAKPDTATLPTQTISGTGNDVKKIDLHGFPAIITFTCEACHHLTSLKTNGDEGFLVSGLNEPYTGSHLVDTRGNETTELTVETESPWTITIADVSTVEFVRETISGHGDQVFYLESNTPKVTADVKYTGDSLFTLTSYGGDADGHVLGNIGSYEGTVKLRPGYVQVESHGDWTITVH